MLRFGSNIVIFFRRVLGSTAFPPKSLPSKALRFTNLLWQKTCAINHVRGAINTLRKDALQDGHTKTGVRYNTNRRQGSRIEVEPLVYLTTTTYTPSFVLNLSKDGMAIQAMEVWVGE
jgi:hypothetical protein